jgi:para-aminobenzoate synthetase / 4-amino-4-deoxychorismate lyase
MATAGPRGVLGLRDARAAGQIEVTEVDPERGLFETVLVSEGRPIRLDAHLARLATSLRDLYGTPLPESVVAGVTAAARGLTLGRMRIDVVPAGPGRLRHTIAVSPIDPAIFFPDRDHGADLRSVQAPAWTGSHKWADRQWLEGVERELGEKVPLLVDGEEVLEAGRANVFIARAGVLVTPPLAGRILPGTARASTLTLAARLGVPTLESPLLLDELRGADEVFLTSSLRGVRPARSLDGEPLLRESPLVPRLADALRADWLGEA